MTEADDATRLQALVAEQAALRRVAVLVARAVQAPTLFDRVCEELGGVLGVESTDMIRFDADGAATIVGAWAKNRAPSFPVGERIPVEGATVTGKLHRTGRPQRVDDYAGVGGELAERLRSFGIRSAAGAPIIVAERLWGGLMAVSERPYAFPADTEHRIADFAELVTAALANAEAREQLAASRARIVEASDEARRRLERDLHDGAQQRLVSLALTLRLLQSRLEGSPEAERELDAARAELDQALDDLRELARGIHPSVLTDQGLAAALHGLAGRAPFQVNLEVEGGDGLSGAVATTAYFLVAEGLTNAAKYARCERVDVRVHVDQERAMVEVSDDGAGGADPDAGTGLRGLADRVSAQGGTLAVQSPRGGGTLLRAQIPIGSSHEATGRQRSAPTPAVL